MVVPARKARKDLSADALFHRIRSGLGKILDPRKGETTIPLGDALMSGFAMFSLKDPSLLAFDERREDPNDNFRTIYGIDHVPCDTQMRSILDLVNPDHLRPLFGDVFRRLQRGKGLERFVYLEGHYLISLDGTGYFSSTKIHCSSCLEKHHRGGGITYSHQMLGATLVHPDLKEVIALAPEPIIKQDGQTKNDCERNATRRWLKHFRQEHPRLPVIIVEDGLAANAPHLHDLEDARVHYIIGVKPATTAFCSSACATPTRRARHNTSPSWTRPAVSSTIFAGTRRCRSTSPTSTPWSTSSNTGRSVLMAPCNISVGSPTSP